MRVVLLSCLLLLVVAGCRAAPVISTPDLPAQTVEPTATQLPTISIPIDTQEVRQTLREVGGGNYIHFFGQVKDALDPISTHNLDTLDPQVVRVRIDLDLWEPEQGQTGESRFQEVSFGKGTFEYMREVRERNADTIIIASMWEVPDWMVSNPEAENNRRLIPDLLPEVVDSIGNWLLHARDAYGVEVDYVSFNEANIGVNIALTPREQVDLIRAAGPKFEEMRLKTRWLLGDTSNMASTMIYVKPIYAAEDIRPYLGPLAFHSWDSQAPDVLIQEIGAYALENDLEVWCTEAGWDPQQWRRPDEFSTWKHAVRLSNIYVRVLRDSRATTMLYWDMMGGDYAINDGSQSFPALHYVTELQEHFPAGSQIVATPDDPIQTLAVLSLAAVTPGGGFSLEVNNQVNTPRTVMVTGLPNGVYSHTRLTEQSGVDEVGQVTVSSGSAELDLPGQSIHFLKLTGSSK